MSKRRSANCVTLGSGNAVDVAAAATKKARRSENGNAEAASTAMATKQDRDIDHHEAAVAQVDTVASCAVDDSKQPSTVVSITSTTSGSDDSWVSHVRLNEASVRAVIMHRLYVLVSQDDTRSESQLSWVTNVYEAFSEVTRSDKKDPREAMSSVDMDRSLDDAVRALAHVVKTVLGSTRTDTVTCLANLDDARDGVSQLVLPLAYHHYHLHTPALGVPAPSDKELGEHAAHVARARQIMPDSPRPLSRKRNEMACEVVDTLTAACAAYLSRLTWWRDERARCDDARKRVAVQWDELVAATTRQLQRTADQVTSCTGKCDAARQAYEQRESAFIDLLQQLTEQERRELMTRVPHEGLGATTGRDFIAAFIASEHVLQTPTHDQREAFTAWRSGAEHLMHCQREVACTEARDAFARSLDALVAVLTDWRKTHEQGVLAEVRRGEETSVQRVVQGIREAVPVLFKELRVALAFQALRYHRACEASAKEEDQLRIYADTYHDHEMKEHRKDLVVKLEEAQDVQHHAFTSMQQLARTQRELWCEHGWEVPPPIASFVAHQLKALIDSLDDVFVKRVVSECMTRLSGRQHPVYAIMSCEAAVGLTSDNDNEWEQFLGDGDDAATGITRLPWGCAVM